MQCHTKLHNVVHQGKKIVVCFVRSVETSPVCQTNINPSSLMWNEKICVVNKNKEIKSPNASLVERTWFHVQSLSCLQSFVWWSGHCIFRKESLVCQQKLAEWGQSWLLGYQDGVEIYEGWTLKVIKVYFPFCWELFFSRTETCRVVWSAIFSVNRNKGFVFIILLPELNGLVR